MNRKELVVVLRLLLLFFFFAVTQLRESNQHINNYEVINSTVQEQHRELN